MGVRSLHEGSPVSTDELPTIVGLTGGIGSGKSTVADFFRELGVAVIDADVIAREVVEPGSEGLAEIVEAFGDDVLSEDGSLDRAALGSIVFDDADARSRLEGITHHRIGQRMLQKAAQAFSEGHDWVIYDAALLVENGLHEAFHALIVVALDRETQIERVMERDGVPRADVIKRIEAQMPLEKKVAVADYVIDNGGSLEETKQQVIETREAIEESLRED